MEKVKNIFSAAMQKGIRIGNRPGVKKYFINTSWLFSGNIVKMFLVFIVGVFVTRYLGPERYGSLSYAISFVGLFAALNSLGLDSIVVKELVNNNERQQDQLMGTSFILRICGNLFALFLITIFTFFFSEGDETRPLIFIIGAGTLFSSLNVINLYYQSKVLSKYVVWSQTIALAVVSVLKVILIVTSASLVYFAIANAFQTVIMSAGLIYFYKKIGGKFKNWQFDISRAKRLLRDGLPLLFSGIAITVYMKIDQVMLKGMLDSGAVGEYAAAVKLSEVWYFIPTAIASSVFPAILNAKKESERKYEKRLQQFYTLLVWIAIGISLPLSLSSNSLCNFLFGEKYVHTGEILSVHIWASVFVFLGVASGRWLISEGLYKYSMYRTIIGAIVNVALNILLIPRYAGIGAAWATLVSYAFSSCFLNIVIKELRIDFKRMLLTISPASIYFLVKKSL
ncbi:flippase [Draconibacterium sp. IB214405]|uniref:flippase n=1 Tax=Draconibacterium sp. IB214405 TaxID=3097352 RepID=UPI002A163EF5|nr:flippase [Draconibacterium sp. IB214405]MDX8338070.1 flippase [Draconibacterium sp. IB214405]